MPDQPDVRHEAKRIGEPLRQSAVYPTPLSRGSHTRCVVVGITIIALMTCGRPQEPEQSRVPESAARDIELPSEDAIARALAPWTGDLDGMMERRYVRMLVTFNKTNYFIDRAETHGLSYDAGKLFEDALNARAKTKTIRVHIMFIPVQRDKIFEELAAGRGDVAAANLTITPERQKRVDFSPPFLANVRELVVTGPDQPPVTKVDDLSGRQVHVRRSSAYFESLTSLNTSLLARGAAPVQIVEAPEALEDEDLLEMVNAGLIPTTIVDDHVGDFWRQLFDQMHVTDVAVRSGGQIAWAIRKGTPQLHEAVEGFVRANPGGSKNFNMLYQRYLKNTQFMKNASSEAEMRKFRQVRLFFEKYGDKYELPWLLIAAQGFQESRLDQNVRSRAGAVGVMQIKPSTAEGPPINIRGVDASAERNIEAGAKYLRFIVDEYFKDEPNDRVNKGLFAVASYNAGPQRIAGLRRKAKAMGLDENRWFGNVEVVAARDIGRETVTYVSNIYKYYVSYNLLLQRAEERRRVRGQ